MDFLTDWKFYLFLVSLMGMAVNALSHFKIVNNDLKHLAIDLKEIKSEQCGIKKKVIKLSEDIANIKGKMGE